MIRRQSRKIEYLGNLDIQDEDEDTAWIYIREWNIRDENGQCGISEIDTSRDKNAKHVESAKMTSEKD